jgi:CBS domain containing-hemolysin-like protein
MPAATNTATAGVEAADSGIASALVNVGRQVGGSIGTSLLSTVAASATAAYLASHGAGAALSAEATVHGYTVAFRCAAAILAVGAVVCGALLTGAATLRRS